MQTIAKKPAVVMTDKEAATKVYEISYLLVSSIPKEKVAENISTLKSVVTKNGGSFIAEGEPEFTALAYTMIKKVGAVNHRFNEGYFGWLKFELTSDKIEAVKKAFEEHDVMLRSLIITTIPENTYLGKKAPAIVRSEDVVAIPVAEIATVEAPVATTEEIDKSIDEMVK